MNNEQLILQRLMDIQEDIGSIKQCQETFGSEIKTLKSKMETKIHISNKFVLLVSGVVAATLGITVPM